MEPAQNQNPSSQPNIYPELPQPPQQDSNYSGSSLQEDQEADERRDNERRHFNKLLRRLFILLVVAPIAMGIYILATENYAQDAGGAAWGAVALFFWAIVDAIAIFATWLIHRLGARSERNRAEAEAAGVDVDGQAQHKAKFLTKVGVALFILSAFGIAATIYVDRSLGVASGLPVWYAVLIYFITPVINIIGIGGAVWAIVSLRKYKLNQKQLLLAVILCLSPFLIWLGFGLVIAENPNFLNPSHLNSGVKQTITLPFTAYLPPASSNYILSTTSPPYLSPNSDSSIKLTLFTLSYTHQSFGQQIYEMNLEPAIAVNKNSTECYAGGSTEFPTGCQYAFTTTDGTVVLSNDDTIGAYGKENPYFFQKGQTYCFFFAADGKAGDVLSTDAAAFINSLRPTSLKNVTILNKNF